MELAALRARAGAAAELHLPVELRARPEGAHAAQGRVLIPAGFRSIGWPTSAPSGNSTRCYTAPHFGFAGADDYYHRASAMRTIDRIRVPALIISAEDDPFVPLEPFTDPPHHGQPAHPADPHAPRRPLRVRVGRVRGDDGYWAERQIVEFAEEALANELQRSA